MLENQDKTILGNSKLAVGHPFLDLIDKSHD
jgi:hypothetical protein